MKELSSKQIMLDIGGWSPLNFNLIKRIGLKEATLLAFLIHQEDFWISIGKIQNDGSFYVTQECLKNWLDISHTTQIKLLNTLESYKLIKIFYKSVPGKPQQTRFIKINKKKLRELAAQP